MKNIPQPNVSVCMPVFNGLPFVADAIKSVLAQDYPNLELVISLDQSTDASDSIVTSFGDPRILKVRNGRPGLFSNLNNAIKNASHDLIQVFCQDDIMLPGFIQSQTEIFAKHPQLAVVMSATGKMDESGLLTSGAGKKSETGVLAMNVWLWKQAYYGAVADSISCIMLNRRLIGLELPFDDTYKVAGDVEFYNRIALQFPMAYSGSNLMLNRAHRNQESRKLSSALPYALEEQRIMEAHWNTLLPPILLSSVRKYRAKFRGALHLRSAVKLSAQGKIKDAVAIVSTVLATYGAHNCIHGSFASRGHTPPPFSPEEFTTVSRTINAPD